MKVVYSTESSHTVNDFAHLQQASVVLDDLLGPQSSGLVSAAWSTVVDLLGRTLYRLTIRDFTGEVFTDFAPDELRNPLHMRVRLNRLWGDLLQVQVNNSFASVSKQTTT